MKLHLEIEEDSLYISGDIGIFDRYYRLYSWLLQRFKNVNHEQDLLIFRAPELNSSEFLYNFKESFDKTFSSYCDISYSEEFKSKIAFEIQNQINFLDFSKQAENIWFNNYDSKELSHFSEVLSQRLPGRELYRLQLLSAYHLSFSQHSCNFSVPGSGKTTIVYAAFAYLNSLKTSDVKYVNKIIVVGPPSSFVPWEEEFFSCFGRKPRSFRISGETNRDSKREVLNGISQDEYELILITYQSVPSLVDDLQFFLKGEQNKAMLVCDEAHKFKNFTGVWSKNLLRVAPFAKSRVVLTGTPCPNGYEDLFNLFKFLYPDKNVIGFNYNHLKNLSKDILNPEIYEMIDNMKPFFVRIKKSDLALPDYKDHPILNNKMNQVEEEIYRELESELLKSDVPKSSLFFRLIQCSTNIHLLKKPLINNIDFEMFGDYFDDSNFASLLSSEKFRQVLDLPDSFVPSKHESVYKIVESLVRQGKKVLIWGVFIDSIKRLNIYLKSKGLNGNYVIGETPKSSGIGESELTREKIVEDFKNNPTTHFLITNPVVLGESISLHKSCHDAIYFEMSYSAAPYFQSKDRIHRVWLDDYGKQINYDTNYYHIITQDTVERNIYNRVQKKLIRMLEVVEQDIPLFSENKQEDIETLISEIG